MHSWRMFRKSSATTPRCGTGLDQRATRDSRWLLFSFSVVWWGTLVQLGDSPAAKPHTIQPQAAVCAVLFVQH
eukprot:3875002-Amphidinium_carterae.1